jgi:hypothetical protein
MRGFGRSFIGIPDARRNLRVGCRAGAVVHCHDSKLWAAVLNQAPTTSKAIAYGTPEMAYEIMRLFTASDVRSREIFVMAGHEGGIVTFGKDLEEAFAVLKREEASIDLAKSPNCSSRRRAGPKA